MPLGSLIILDKLLEASCNGDLDGVKTILGHCKSSDDVNQRHKINGWTPLHWAAKRNHSQIVQTLLEAGASPDIPDHKNKYPIHVTDNKEILSLLKSKSNRIEEEEKEETNLENNKGEDNLGFVPNYLKNPPLNYQTDLGPIQRVVHFQDNEAKNESDNQMEITINNNNVQKKNELIILKVRIADDDLLNKDFIEIDFIKSELTTLRGLIETAMNELDVAGDKRNKFLKLRKLPNTKLRRDVEVTRLTNYQELELVFQP